MDPSKPPSTRQAELQLLATLATPVIIGNLGMMGLGMVDILMVGNALGYEALGSLALAHSWSFSVLVLLVGASSGLDPLMTQAYGGGRPREAGLAMIRGVPWMCLLCVLAVVGHAVLGPVLTAMGQPPALVPDASQYARVLIWGIPAFALHLLLTQLLRAAGEMTLPTVVILLANGVNLVGNGLFLWMGYGIEGVAWSTNLVRWFSLALLFWVGRDHLRQAWPRTMSTSVQELLAVGAIALPVSIQFGLESWSFALSTLLAGLLGEVEVAAHSIALNLASLTFMVPLGLAVATTTRVGNLIGAGHPWSQAGRISMVGAIVVMCASAGLMLLAPTTWVQMYNQEPLVVTLAVSILPIAAAFQIFDGVQVVGFGVLRGTGDTRYPAIVPLIGFWILGIPLGSWLAFERELGLSGLWVGLLVGLAVMSALLVVRIRRMEGLQLVSSP